MRQGMLLQASLSGSLTFFEVLILGAFLFAIVLVPFPSVLPRLRQHILDVTPGIRFLSDLARIGIRLAPAHGIDLP
ncbi:hypothetical protein KSD_96000 [Ktedonobacter sp. SOSP1-85]|nr:hypothetical protein KSD_96000 [Ktedonobacter sp. SOSP1-85]